MRTHDLLRLPGPAALLTGAEPAWVADALAEAPWVVVRRSAATDGYLPVGVRGPARHQRHAAQVAERSVLQVARPERLRPAGPDRTPALAALRTVTPVLDGLGHQWGPVGSVGFELATGRPTTTPASDLDVIVRCDRLPPPDWAADLLARLPARADCLLETRAGAVALAELATGAGSVVLRTSGGPRLVSP